MPRPWMALCASAFVSCVITLAGCTAMIEADQDSLGVPPKACSPGEIANCACATGATGRQQCNDGGSFDLCVCGVAGIAGAGAPPRAGNR